METYGHYAVSTYAYLSLTLEEAVRKIAGEGWKAIEIMCEGPHGELLDWPAERLAELKRFGSEHGIAWTLHAPITGCNPATRYSEPLRASLDLLVRTIRVAEALECAHIVVHPGEADGDEATAHESSSPAGGLAADDEGAALRVAAFLREALHAAEAPAVSIALENVPPYPGLLGTDAAFLGRVLQLADSPRIGIVFDVGHAHLTGAGQCLSSLRSVLFDIVSIHLSDNGGKHDDHQRLGAGTVPLEETVELLKKAGYSGSWVIEMRDAADVQPSAEWLRQRGI
ncbi:sugar phosphate isomerase/epimerase family protein [Paenibacillus mesophilus]|uniref:sugar phosphate isomerase/epimerase family protein n=1 Tax=Paenibacillus mesophilus TaxID=2582849 RepID=UPI001EE3A4D9|nr:sugar phosphate isomerase/epimerase family protein [Paenibacillus mesophilus]